MRRVEGAAQGPFKTAAEAAAADGAMASRRITVGTSWLEISDVISYKPSSKFELSASQSGREVGKFGRSREVI